MGVSLLEIYDMGWRDGCAAAQSSAFSEARAAEHARAYMDHGMVWWGLTPRKAIRVMSAYHAGYVDGAKDNDCLPCKLRSDE